MACMGFKIREKFSQFRVFRERMKKVNIRVIYAQTVAFGERAIFYARLNSSAYRDYGFT